GCLEAPPGALGCRPRPLPLRRHPQPLSGRRTRSRGDTVMARRLLGRGAYRICSAGRARSSDAPVKEEEAMKEVDDIVVPVRKDVVVRCSSARAFWIFTREIDAWWPLK